MQVGIRVFGHVIIKHDVHSFYVHTTTKEICRHQNSLLKILQEEKGLYPNLITQTKNLTGFQDVYLEKLISLQTFLLIHSPMDVDRRKILIF